MKRTYRFSAPKDGTESTGLPNRLQKIERLSEEGVWEVVGYIQVHLHAVSFHPEREIEDISIGLTARINPKRARVSKARKRR